MSPLKATRSTLCASLLLAAAAAGQTISSYPPNIPTGGRAMAVSVNPTNDNYALVASESGGLFSTSNRGATWSHIDTLPMFRLRDVAYALQSPAGQQVVLATGRSDSRAVSGGGIWRSTDGGQTWAKPLTAELRPSWRQAAYGIAFEPGTSNAYVGTDYGLAISRDWGATWAHVVVNTNTDPSVEQCVYNVIAQAGGIVDVLGNPWHMRSTNSAETFGLPTNPFAFGRQGVHSLAASPLQNDVLFVAVDAATPPSGCGGRSSTLYEVDFSPGGAAMWTQVHPGTCLGLAGRSAWVASHRSRDGLPDHLDIYFGDGLSTWRQTCARRTGSAPCCSISGWTLVTGLHADQNGMAFSSTGNCAEFIVCDGGIFAPADSGALNDCGGNWQLVGSGPNGYDALQIYDVIGQLIRGSAHHTELYFGTQDNAFWSSSDGGHTWPFGGANEGFHLQAPRYAASSDGQLISFTGSGPNWKSAAHLQDIQPWSNPPATYFSNPTLLAPGLYGQYIFNRPMVLMLTTNFGANWYSVPTPIPYNVTGWPQAARDGNALTIYQPVLRAGLDVGLIRIRGLRTTGTFDSVTVEDADAHGFGSLGTYMPGDAYILPFPVPVFAVDPKDPAHLLTADSAQHAMILSTNGGADWQIDQPLTDLVTGFDPASGQREFRFNIRLTEAYDPPAGATLQPHAIAFDPLVWGHILVGTEAAGIFRSADGGQSWQSIAGSRQVTGITSFFFIDRGYLESNPTAIVSTYGRGLWKLHLPASTGRAFGLSDLLANAWSGGWGRDPFTGVAVSLDQLLNPENCPACQYILVLGGAVRDLTLDSMGQVAEIAIDSGNVIASSTDGQPIALDLPILSGQQTGSFKSCPGLAKIVLQGGIVKGLVLEAGKLTAAIAGFGSLPGESTLASFMPKPSPLEKTSPVAPPIGPYLTLIGSPAAGGGFNLFTGDALTILGSGFSTKPVGAPITLIIGSQTLTKVIPDIEGAFKTAMPINLPPGLYTLTARQQDASGQTLETAAPLMVSQGEVEDVFAATHPVIRSLAFKSTPADALIINVEAQAGRTYVLETSSDLSKWTATQTNNPTTDQFQFTEPFSPKTPARFYRIAVPPSR